MEHLCDTFYCCFVPNLFVSVHSNHYITVWSFGLFSRIALDSSTSNKLSFYATLSFIVDLVLAAVHFGIRCALNVGLRDLL